MIRRSLATVLVVGIVLLGATAPFAAGIGSMGSSATLPVSDDFEDGTRGGMTGDGSVVTNSTEGTYSLQVSQGSHDADRSDFGNKSADDLYLEATILAPGDGALVIKNASDGSSFTDALKIDFDTSQSAIKVFSADGSTFANREIDGSYDGGTWYNVKASTTTINGNDHARVKVWAVGSNEPSSWDANISHSLDYNVDTVRWTGDNSNDADAYLDSYTFDSYTNVKFASLSGTVTETDGSAIDGATVELRQNGVVQDTTTTNATGAYAFEGVANGSYTVAVAPRWYENRSKQITVSGSTVVDFTLDRIYVLEGVVRNSSGDRLDDATVRADGGQLAPEKTNTTDSQGRFRFELPSAEYQLTADADGYRSQGRVFNLTSNTTRDFSLRPDDAPYVAEASPTSYRKDRTVTLRAKIEDVNDDAVEARIYWRNRSGEWERQTTEVFQSTEGGRWITAEVDSQLGQNAWYVYMEDRSKSTTSDVFTYRTPGKVRIYNATDLSQVSETVTAEIVSQESDFREERTTASGILDLEGLPDEQLLVRFSAPSYFDQSLSLSTPARQESVLLYPEDDNQSNTSTSEQRFELDDQTGGLFPPSETYLVVETYYLGEWRHVGSGRFGAINRVSIPLQTGQTYRLVVRNPEQDTRRNLGQVVYDPAVFEDPETLTVTTADDRGPDNEPPVARFDYRPAAPTTNDSIEFDGLAANDSDGEVVRWEWDLTGDGSVDATGPRVSYRYPSGGNYSVTLTVEDDDGATDTVTRQVFVASTNRAPVAKLTINQSAPTTAQPVEWNGTASYDPEGAPLSYRWSGDGSPQGTVDETLVINYSSPGNKTIEMTVEDNASLTDTVEMTIYVAPNASTANEVPIPRIDYSPQNPNASESITFNGSNSTDPDGTIDAYEWDLDGDGEFDATGENVSFAYPTNGTYRVRLRVTDNDSTTNSTVENVTVGSGEPGRAPDEAPQAAIDYDPAAPAAQQEVRFNASASTDPNGSIVAYRWDLTGDGNFSDARGVEASTKFPSAGTYQVSVEVMDDLGQTDVATVEVVVANDSQVGRVPGSIDVDPDARTLLAERNATVTVAISNRSGTTLRQYRVEVTLINGSNLSDETRVALLNGTSPTGEVFRINQSLNLSGHAGDRVRVAAIAWGDNGVSVDKTVTYQVRASYDTRYSLLGGLARLKTQIPAGNWGSFSTMLALLVTVLGTAGVAVHVPMSSELLGIVALAFMVGFASIGWVGYPVVLVAGAGYVGFAAIRRGL